MRHPWGMGENIPRPTPMGKVKTPENATPGDLRAEESVRNELAGKFGSANLFVDDAERSWYKLAGEVLVARGEEASIEKELVPLSEQSKVVEALKPTNMRRIYVPLEMRAAAKEIVASMP